MSKLELKVNKAKKDKCGINLNKKNGDFLLNKTNFTTTWMLATYIINDLHDLFIS